MTTVPFPALTRTLCWAPARHSTDHRYYDLGMNFLADRIHSFACTLTMPLLVSLIN
jgi:hypothetical protein